MAQRTLTRSPSSEPGRWAGMAATFARNGFETTLFDVKPEQLDKAKGTVDFVYTTLTNGGFMIGGRCGCRPGPSPTRPIWRGAEGRRFCAGDRAGAEGAQAAGLPGCRSQRRRRRDPGLEHLRYSHHRASRR